MKYSIEEQLNIVAAMEEISPAQSKTAYASDLEDDELDTDSLSLVTAARGSIDYNSFLKKAKEHPTV
jgi:hypothetical protein